MSVKVQLPSDRSSTPFTLPPPKPVTEDEVIAVQTAWAAAFAPLNDTI